jgi:excisionase family DNA binding protein
MITHVDANNFYASCEQLFNPALRGQPVVVLSNNDGVIVARSAEAKALGIDMAQPFFQIEPVLRQHGVHVLSSNYTLYDDMSNRLTAIYRRFAVAVEVYSIDECFLSLPEGDPGELLAYGRRLRRTVRQWTGLPVSVGIAATKTLAKLGNRLAKRVLECRGVCVLPDDRAVCDALSRVALTDLWGVSDGFERRLAAMGKRLPGGQWLTIKQASESLAVSEDFVRSLIGRGYIQAIKLPGGRNAPVRVARQSVIDLCQASRLMPDRQPGNLDLARPRRRRSASAANWGV